MRMGIDKYNAECRSIVMRYSGEWRSTVERMGRWIDFDNDYKTLNLPFMESVWWAFSELFKNGMVYRGLRVMPYSTGCTTPLSNFEAGQAYHDVNDPAGQFFFSISFFFSFSDLVFSHCRVSFGGRPQHVVVSMDDDALDVALQSSPLCSSGLHVHQDSRRRTQPDFYHSRRTTENFVQRSEKGKVQETWSIPWFRYEGMALCAAIRIFY